MKLERVIYEKSEGIGIVTIDNEEQLNALSPEVRRDLYKVYDEVEKDDDIKIMILTGKGKAFCAGADISTVINLKDLKGAHLFLHEIMDFLSYLESFPKPVIAAVNGFALGGGIEVALSCDIIIASEKARFGGPEAAIGVVPGFAMLRLPQVVGPHRAKEIMMTCRQVPGEEAYRMGLATKLVPHEKLMEESIATAKEIMSKAPMAIQLIKSCVNRHFGGEEMSFGVDATTHLFATEDQKEGMSAFLNKRKPNFQGK